MSVMTIVYIFSRDITVLFSRDITVFAAQEPLIVLPITKDSYVLNQKQPGNIDAEKAVTMKKVQPLAVVSSPVRIPFTTSAMYQPNEQFLAQTKVQNPYAYGLPKEETEELLLIALGFFYCGVVLLTAEQLLYVFRSVIRAGMVKIRQLSPFVAED